MAFDTPLTSLACAVLMALNAERMPVADSAPVVRSASTPPAQNLAAAAAPLLTRGADRRVLALQPDTLRRRARAVEYSDGYNWRLTWHRRSSWLMLPLFAASYFSGDQILEKGSDAPEWARALHRPAATGSAVLFGFNTVTGTWNLWESRSNPAGRWRRLTHSALFYAASAGFVYAGTTLADEAEQSDAKRRQHRNVALASMSASTASWLLMLIGN